MTLTITIGVDISRPSKDIDWTIQESLEELSELARTAGLTVIRSFSQQRERPNRTSYIGKGKLEEIKSFILENDVKCLLTDDELTPAQSKFIEKDLSVKVIDRTGLILDIFSQRAQTYEAQLQVELAQLEYLVPRLTRLWTHLSRLGGGIGTRGPGEKQLESDKRQIAKRVGIIKRKLSKIQKDRQLRRDQRHSLPIFSGAIVGYTNAGKSTLMNRLTSSNVFVENKLFATLDPTTRKFVHSEKQDIVLTDTVGFIQKLPTHLIKAFYSTLEEVTDADFLIHVVDASHPKLIPLIETSLEIINDLNASKKPHIFVFNKWDSVAKPNKVKALLNDFSPSIFISATHPSCVDTVSEAIKSILEPFRKEMTFFIPYQRMDVVNLIHTYGEVHEIKYEETIYIRATMNHIIGEKLLASLYPKDTQNHA